MPRKSRVELERDVARLADELAVVTNERDELQAQTERLQAEVRKAADQGVYGDCE